MHYLLTLTYRDGEGPEEGTPEFDAEMKVWGALNEEMRAGRRVVARQRPAARDGDDRPRGETSSPTARTRRPRRSCSPSTSSTSRTWTRRSRWSRRMPAAEYGSVEITATDGLRDGVSADSLERAFRDERGAVLATITRRLDGDLALAEDVVQDAFVAAAVEWDRRGVPDRPGAWLTTTAWRKALDRLRHERVADAHAPELVEPRDLRRDRLRARPRWTTTSCGCSSRAATPRWRPEARMALTLRSVAGLTVPEIARAFLSSEAAMERRLTRARNKVTDARHPVPRAARRPAAGAARRRAARHLPRLQRGPRGDARPSCGDGGDPARAPARAADARRGRGARAARAAAADRRALAAPACAAASSSRSTSRTARCGTRPRSPRASRCSIARCGCRRRARTSIQAAIAALHAQAPSFAATDWAQIAGLYAELARHRPVAGRGGQPRGGGRVRGRARPAGPRRAAGRRAAGALPAAARRARGAAAPRGRRRRRRRGASGRDRALRQRGRALRAAPARQRDRAQRARQRERRTRPAARARSRRRTTRSRPRRRTPRPRSRSRTRRRARAACC